ncbi:Insect cuticle protein [Trinorchestia longiramus]|nr:Insect cuticle protein [Trinorchestia longiramus]
MEHKFHSFYEKVSVVGSDAERRRVRTKPTFYIPAQITTSSHPLKHFSLLLSYCKDMAVVRCSVVVMVATAMMVMVATHPVDPYGGGHKGFKFPPKPYAFSYGIEDKHYGPSFMQQEKSDGHTVKGSYTVQLPDGRLQTVTYTADHDNGFFADVKYSGKAQYPSKGAPPFIVKPHHGGGGGGGAYH